MAKNEDWQVVQYIGIELRLRGIRGTDVLSTALFSTWTILASDVVYSLYQHTLVLFKEDKGLKWRRERLTGETSSMSFSMHKKKF